MEPSASEATIFVSGTGRLENFTVEDARERVGLPGVVVPLRYGRTVSSLVGLAGRARENAAEGPNESRETREGGCSDSESVPPSCDCWLVCVAGGSWPN